MLLIWKRETKDEPPPSEQSRRWGKKNSLKAHINLEPWVQYHRDGHVLLFQSSNQLSSCLCKTKHAHWITSQSRRVRLPFPSCIGVYKYDRSPASLRYNPCFKNYFFRYFYTLNAPPSRTYVVNLSSLQSRFVAIYFECRGYHLERPVVKQRKTLCSCRPVLHKSGARTESGARTYSCPPHFANFRRRNGGPRNFRFPRVLKFR